MDNMEIKITLNKRLLRHLTGIILSAIVLWIGFFWLWVMRNINDGGIYLTFSPITVVLFLLAFLIVVKAYKD